MIDRDDRRLALPGFHWIDSGASGDFAHLVIGDLHDHAILHRTERTVCGTEVLGDTYFACQRDRMCAKCVDRVQIDGNETT